MGEDSKDVEEQKMVPTFGDTVAGSETVQQYPTSFPTDDASMQ
jgi:hypothetical protein